LARAAGVDATHRILDVGSGLGGPARCLAGEFGCRVTGIDLSEQYCRVATMLSERAGLGDRVGYRQGDALNLPFADGTFDVVWTEHMAMNVPDKARLYGEMYRVLVPGGTLAIYDILEGPASPVYFPVPWSRTPDTSALAAPDELRSLLESAGFEVTAWHDTTDVARDWFVAVAERIRKQGIPPLGWHLLMGDDYRAMAENQRRNLEEDRIVLAQIVARKSS
jgi:ubiquinone/menaquinone biosynthesis C-methylase UbiE